MMVIEPQSKEREIGGENCGAGKRNGKLQWMRKQFRRRYAECTMNAEADALLPGGILPGFPGTWAEGMFHPWALRSLNHRHFPDPVPTPYLPGRV